MRRLRHALDISQSELAERANLSLRAVQAIECENSSPRAVTVAQLASALGVSSSELMDGPIEPIEHKEPQTLAEISPDELTAKIVAVLEARNAQSQINPDIEFEVNDYDRLKRLEDRIIQFAGTDFLKVLEELHEGTAARLRSSVNHLLAPTPRRPVQSLSAIERSARVAHPVKKSTR